MSTKYTLSQEIINLRANIVRLSASSNEDRIKALKLMAKGLVQDRTEIFKANDKDMELAKDENTKESLVARLKFDEHKMDSVLAGIKMVANSEDPIGSVQERTLLDNDLLLEKVSFPLGVIGMIFEARPDALVQIISLCLKSGNGIVLKGGKEAMASNRALVKSIKNSLKASAIGNNWILLIESHEDVDTLLKMDGYIDLLIPRGSNKFVRYVMDHTNIPVMGHSDGICAIYVDESADINQSVEVCFDSKTQYPSACNAVETLLVHKNIAPAFLPKLKAKLAIKNTIIHGDSRTSEIIECIPTTSLDWDSEYLTYEIAIKIVDSEEEAIIHIAQHGSHHTDAILSNNEKNIKLFMLSVDSADVFVNCSTRFADGYRFGLGAEVGISTSKLHARGPVGLKGLMSTKYLLRGNGQIVSSYSEGENNFIHKALETDSPAMCK
ncbi:MAG: glutamate-5-semialdehyde dehydrogenase [Spirochaetaceae bacterium]|nr:glutamate-5-semialdehyde dehydrogenase [Spirochaetaceae bacterium]